MSKRILQDELYKILQVIAGFPEVLGGILPRRILQRHLALLVEQNRLIVEERARACRYQLPKITDKIITGKIVGTLPNSLCVDLPRK